MARPPLRIGVVYDFRNPPDSPISTPDFYAQILEQATFVDQLGYDQIWFTEHHFVDDGYLPAFVPVAGAIGARTQRVRLSTDIALLPFYHPLRLAEDMAVLDNLTGGRMELGVGMGYIRSEFAGFGIPRSRRVSLTEEGVEILQLAWKGEPFSYHGKRYEIDDACVYPRPVQEGGPPLWMATMTEAGAHRVARYGLHLLPQGSREAVIDPWRADLLASGRDPDDFRVGLIRSVLVTDDPERDWPSIREGERYKVRRYAEWIRESGDTYTAFDRDAEPIPQTYVVGDADHVYTELASFLDEYGITDLCTFGTCPGLPAEVMNASLERFATDVIPRLKARSATR